MFIHLPVLDPLLSIGISLWVLTNVYRNLRASFKIMLQATPEDVDLEHLEEELREVDEVVSVHDLHLWTMDGESHIMTLHVVSNTSNPEKLKQNIIEQVKTFNIDHVTIELENPEVDCQHKCEA
jgi:cobalt-zinc-cadmium efflux system protein